MKSVRPLALLIACALLLPSGARADSHGWAAATLESSSAVVAEGDHVTVDCHFGLPAGPNLFAGVGGSFIFADLNFATDSEDDFFSQLVNTTRDVAVQLRGGPVAIGTSLEGISPTSDNTTQLWDFTAPGAGVAEYAWASWGASSSCQMKVNTNTVAVQTLDGENASLYYVEDFDTVQGASLSVRPAIQSYDHAHMQRTLPSPAFMFLGDVAQRSNLDVKATDPLGSVIEVDGSSGKGDLVRGAFPGAWSFDANGTSVDGDWPPVATITLPSDYFR